MAENRPSQLHARIPVTLAGMVEGMRLTWPLVPGVLMAALACGAASAEKGLSLAEAVFMSLTVYAGASQLLALELWPAAWTGSALAAVVLVTVAVNLRLVLMGAALQPWLSQMPRGTPYLALACLTDANFIVGTRYRAQGGADAGVFIGCGVLLWVVWTLATVPGHLLGDMLADPRRYGLDLVMPLLFTVMAVGLFRLRRDRLVWPIAAGVAVLTSHLADGYWFIIAGALAGSLAAGALRVRA